MVRRADHDVHLGRSTVVMTATRRTIVTPTVYRPKRIMRSTPTLQTQLRPRSPRVHRLLVLPHSRPHQCPIGDVIRRAVVARPPNQILRRYPSVSLRHLHTSPPTPTQFNINLPQFPPHLDQRRPCPLDGGGDLRQMPTAVGIFDTCRRGKSPILVIPEATSALRRSGPGIGAYRSPSWQGPTLIGKAGFCHSASPAILLNLFAN
jgi:hypothetical protein